MNIEAILRELDAEIEKLERVRAMFLSLSSYSPSIETPKKRPEKKRALPMTPVIPEPQLVVLPPKVKREYQPRPKPATSAPRALAAPVSDRPVFVPRVALIPPAAEAAPKPALTAEALEKAVRQNLFGSAA
ncbi:MAG TPA: hypothetical protein VGN16_20950 [Acidobacteriaceae bacterium]